MTQKVKDSMLHAPSGASDRVLAVDQDGNVEAKTLAGADPSLVQQVEDNTLSISEIYTSSVQQTITQWDATNWVISPFGLANGLEAKLLDLTDPTNDINTEVSDVFDRMTIESHPTNPHNVIKVQWRGQKVFHTIRLKLSITTGNSQFYRVEIRRGGDDSVVLRKTLSRNPDEAEQTIEMVTFTYKADDPYVTDGFYLAFVNDSGIQCEIDGAYSLTIFNHYQYLTPTT